MSSTLLCSASRFRVRAFVFASLVLFVFFELGFSFCLGLFTFFPAVQQTTDRIGNRALVGAR